MRIANLRRNVKNQYQWLLFDADETLLDYVQTEKHAFKASCLASGVEFQHYYLERYSAINQSLWRELEAGRITQTELKTKRFQILFEELRLNQDPSAFCAEYLTNLGKTDFTLDGAVDLLKKLNSKYEIAIVTNGLKKVQEQRIKNTNIANYIKTMIVSEDVGVSKPDPRFFEYVVKQIKFNDKKRMLIIGDNLNSDIIGGNRFGIDTCWFNPSEKKNGTDAKPAYTVGSLAELEKMLL